MVKFPGLKFVQRNLKIYVTGVTMRHPATLSQENLVLKSLGRIMLPVAFAPKGIGANISN